MCTRISIRGIHVTRFTEKVKWDLRHTTGCVSGTRKSVRVRVRVSQASTQTILVGSPFFQMAIHKVQSRPHAVPLLGVSLLLMMGGIKHKQLGGQTTTFSGH